jgi:hypothetical protein
MRFTICLIQWHFVTFLYLKKLQQAGNIARINASFVPKKYREEVLDVKGTCKSLEVDGRMVILGVS